MYILELMSAPGVEALINIVLVFTLVSITAYYAHQASKQADQASKQTEIMRGKGKRRYIVELMKYIIAPLIHTLEQEIELLEKREYDWLHISLSACNISKLVVYPEILFNDLKRDFPDLGRKIEDHDNRVSTLQEKLKSLDQAIYTPDFEREYLARIEEYNDKVTKSGGDPGRSIDTPSTFVGHIVEYIINDVRKMPKNYTYPDFGRDHWAEFIKIRDREDIKTKIDEINCIAEELKGISQELKGDIEKHRDSYRQEYHISIGEFDKSLLPITWVKWFMGEVED